MRLRVFGGFLLLYLCAAQQAGRRAPATANPTVEMKGTIARVQAAPAQGTPTLQVEQSGRTVKVLLGPLWYLMEQDFRPKTGALVEVKGFRAGDEVVAIQITLPGSHKTLRLRDEAGWPLWEVGKHR